MRPNVNVAGGPVSPPREPPESGGIGAQVGRMVDGFSRLVTQHITLARLELKEEARAVGGSLARLAAFAPFALVGYALLNVGLSLLVGRWIGREWGFVLVGGVNAVVGAVGMWRAAEGLRSRPAVLEATAQELRSSATSLLAPVGRADRLAPREDAHARKP